MADYLGADAIREAWLSGLVPPAVAVTAPVVLSVASDEIREWRRRFPLPEGVEDLIVNRKQLAEALATSENTLTKWLGKGMPCETEGGNGRDYAFQLGDCYAWRMATLEAEQAAKTRADEAAAQLAMSFLGEEGVADAQAGLSPREIREMSEADIMRNKAAELRGDLVRADRVRACLEEMLERIRRNLVTLPDYAEREFGLEPHQVQALEQRGHGVLGDMRRDLEALFAGGQVVPMAGRDPAADMIGRE